MLYLLLIGICIFAFFQTTINIFLPAIIGNEMIAEERRMSIYLSTCRKKAFGQWYWDEWQLRDFYFATDPTVKEVMLLRNRGGSKSRDGAIMAVWLAYQRNRIGDYNRILWYSAKKSQLTAILTYFRQNRYVKYVTFSKVVLYNGSYIDLRLMSSGQAVAPRADIIFFDEEQSMDKAIYQYALGTLIGSIGKKIHMGTTEFDTILEENYKRLSLKGLVLEHHIDECSWTTVEEALEAFDGMPQFIIDSQLYCKWVRPGGAVFPNIEIGYATPPFNCKKYYGVDPNPKSGHALVELCYIDENTIYVMSELPPYTDPFDFSRQLQKLLVKNTDVEIEENAGEEFIKVFFKVTNREYEGRVTVMRWDEENKHDRIFNIRKFKIIVNPACKNVIHHLRGAVWNPKEPKARLLKTPEQHYLDAFIHAAQKINSGGKVYSTS